MPKAPNHLVGSSGSNQDPVAARKGKLDTKSSRQPELLISDLLLRSQNAPIDSFIERIQGCYISS